MGTSPSLRSRYLEAPFCRKHPRGPQGPCSCRGGPGQEWTSTQADGFQTPPAGKIPSEEMPRKENEVSQSPHLPRGRGSSSGCQEGGRRWGEGRRWPDSSSPAPPSSLLPTVSLVGQLPASGLKVSFSGSLRAGLRQPGVYGSMGVGAHGAGAQGDCLPPPGGRFPPGWACGVCRPLWGRSWLEGSTPTATCLPRGLRLGISCRE